MSSDHLLLLRDIPNTSSGSDNINTHFPFSPSYGADHDDDDEWLFLAQPFYPTPEPTLDDFLLPLSPASPLPPPVPASPPSLQMYSLSIEPVVAGAQSLLIDEDDGDEARGPGAFQRSLSTQCLDGGGAAPSACLGKETGADGYFAHMMRRACSTGDLQMMVGKVGQAAAAAAMAAGNPLSPTCTEGESPAVAYSVGRYSPEERMQRIHRYRAKRNHRNFNKTIKYACRKTLADSRPRVRGRFARSESVGDVSKPAATSGSGSSNSGQFRRNGSVDDEDEEDLAWIT